jgi:hypothetical protein
MLYLITLEPLENRYTLQWKNWFNEKFKNSIEIDGITLSKSVNSKNFLDPFQTNIWKSEQIIKICKLFNDGAIKPNDKFLFLDAWHYGIIALKYMSKLSNISVKIYGLWHAGAYDDFDLLGTSGLFKYFDGFEKSIFKCLNLSFVATNFHKELILQKYKKQKNICVTGFPFNFNDLPKLKNKKENIIVFPHRLSIEKQPEILKDLVPELKKYNIDVIFCQENKLSKLEYYDILSRSKCCFSSSLQETWGIGTFEALFYKNIPIVPNRLSYIEMYDNFFKYPKKYSRTFNDYKKVKSFFINLLIDRINNYYLYVDLINNNFNFIKKNYCDINILYNRIMND